MFKKIGFGVCVLTLLGLCQACGTSSTNRNIQSSTSNTIVSQKHLTKTDYASIPMKDYEPVQIVTYKTTVKTTKQSSLFSAPSNAAVEGSAIVYSYLIEEARKLNAHGIINVRVETERTCDDTIAGSYGNEKSDKECILEIIGTALAIRYTTAIIPVCTISDTTDADDVANTAETAKAGLLQRVFSNNDPNH